MPSAETMIRAYVQAEAFAMGPNGDSADILKYRQKREILKEARP